MPDTPNEVTYIKVTNADVYKELVHLRERIQRLEIKVYGVIGGLSAALLFLLKQELWPG